MSKFPTKKQLEDLVSFKEPICLSVYVPYIEPSSTENPARIEMKNLLRDAHMKLMSAGANQKEATRSIRQIGDYMQKNEARPTRGEGLVFFSHPKFFAHYHIPDKATPYKLTVGTGFNLEPLEKMMRGNQQYYVLALAHKNVQLYRGDHFGLEPVELENFPTDMKKALGIDEYPKSSETHSVAPTAMGKGSEAQHGQYNVSQIDKNMLLEFFRRIDRRLHRMLTNRQMPLIVAGVNYLLPIYRKANTYPGLLDGSIVGNQEHADLEKIRDKAWKLVTKATA